MKIFWWRRCRHRFKAQEVTDLNVDPKCTRCGKFFSAINSKRRYRFKPVNDTEFKLERL
jgi:ribosomal protein L34E